MYYERKTVDFYTLVTKDFYIAFCSLVLLFFVFLSLIPIVNIVASKYMGKKINAI